ncbi:MAG: hypothetical protein JWO56_1888 [Acidobacteria bacterium]|nr:hypothetical protein [Acidobacteriota bacterium]
MYNYLSSKKGALTKMNALDRADVVSFEGAQAMIASDDALGAALGRVNRLDFTMLKRKLMEEHNWTAEFTDEVESLYRKFLALNARYPDQKICPTGPIDSFWHGHILDTRAYAQDCEAVFGHMLHHFPYFGMRGPEDQAALERAFRESVELFTWNFGIDPTAGDILARSCSSQRCP